jgi:hypothetical protein
MGPGFTSTITLLAPGDAIIPIDVDPEGTGTPSSSPGFEAAPNAIDGDVMTKYLNFGEVNSGFIVTPSTGEAVMTSFQMTTANDAEARDPSAFALYGTNDPIQSTEHSRAEAENWTLIAAGAIDLPPDRRAEGPQVQVANGTTYRSYLFVVTDVKDELAANSMQFSEIQFHGFKRR